MGNLRQEATHWSASAAYDWATARDLMTARRFSFAVFLAHPSVEKRLQAAVIELVGSFPPLTHNLLELARRLPQAPPPEVETAMMRLAPHDTASRYPDVLGGPPHESYNAGIARERMGSAEEALAWIDSQLRSSGTSTT